MENKFFNTKSIFLVLMIFISSLFILGCGSVKDKQMTLDLAFGSRAGTYSGNIKNDLPDGNGKFEYKNENNETTVFDGEFENGHFKKGTLTIQSTKYGILKRDGEFKSDRLEGQGKFFVNNKLYYEGDFKDGKPNGKGKRYDENGKVIYEGNFENGMPMADTVNIGQEVSFADWKYKVSNVTVQSTVGNNPASGIFVIVSVDAVNNANTERQLGSQDFFILVDNQGRTFKANDKIMMKMHEIDDFKGSWYLSEIGPSLSAQDIKFIFDVPKDAKNLKLVPANGLGKANPVLVKESL